MVNGSLAPQPPEESEFVVRAEESGLRLDVFLARHLPDWSRSQLQRLIQAGFVLRDSCPVRKAGETVAAGSSITVRLQREETLVQPEDLPLKIVYEDDDLVIVDKPAGMVVHLGAGVRSGTLVNALLHRVGTLSSVGGAARPGIIHRLDKLTSGLVIVAKNDYAHRQLAQQFQGREVHKNYTVLVHGRVARVTGEINRPVGRDPHRRVRMTVGGLRPREALTRYRVTRRFPHFTLLDAEPRTGRTHQIRVHFSSLGYPLVGDTIYGAPGRLRLGKEEIRTLPRHFLHAASLEFRHPRSGSTVRFQSELPEELTAFLTRVEEVDR